MVLGFYDWCYLYYLSPKHKLDKSATAFNTQFQTIASKLASVFTGTGRRFVFHDQACLRSSFASLSLSFPRDTATEPQPHNSLSTTKPRLSTHLVVYSLRYLFVPATHSSHNRFTTTNHISPPLCILSRTLPLHLAPHFLPLPPTPLHPVPLHGLLSGGILLLHHLFPDLSQIIVALPTNSHFPSGQLNSAR